MSDPGKDCLFVTQYYRNLRGGSQPILAEASDGQLYVVKFTNNLQGPNLPFNEAMGTNLYRALKLPVPVWRPLLLTDSFIDQNPACWMQGPVGRLRPASGICFGSRFLGCDGLRLFEILPGSSFSRVRNRRDFWLSWLSDICAGHTDNRQAIFREENDGKLTAFFVDHGYMFGGPNGEQQAQFRASRFLDSRVYPLVSLQLMIKLQKVVHSLPADSLWQKMLELPEEWKTHTAIQKFAECLDRFTKLDQLRNIFDTLVDFVHQESVCDDKDVQYRRRPPASVLFTGIQVRGVDRRVVA
jgi:hypothetical protein